jgi:hypothetical protein
MKRCWMPSLPPSVTFQPAAPRRCCCASWELEKEGKATVFFLAIIVNRPAVMIRNNLGGLRKVAVEPKVVFIHTPIDTDA